MCIADGAQGAPGVWSLLWSQVGLPIAVLVEVPVPGTGRSVSAVRIVSYVKGLLLILFAWRVTWRDLALWGCASGLRLALNRGRPEAPSSRTAWCLRLSGAAEATAGASSAAHMRSELAYTPERSNACGMRAPMSQFPTPRFVE